MHKKNLLKLEATWKLQVSPNFPIQYILRRSWTLWKENTKKDISHHTQHNNSPSTGSDTTAESKTLSVSCESFVFSFIQVKLKYRTNIHLIYL
jgi:hypothetical protein